MELLLAAATTSFDGSGGGQEGDLAAREIHEIQQCQHAESSVEKYRNLMALYLRWVVENKPELATKTFTASLTFDKSDSPTNKCILATFDSAPASPPLYFANLEPDDFLKWVHSRKNKKSDQPLSYSSYNSMRSAFNYLCEIYEWGLPENFVENLSTYFSGLKRTLAKETADGTGKSTKGKQPISMRLYRRLAEVMLRSPARDKIFARAFMLLTWNLMARAGSTAAVCFSHLEWGEDALRVYFAHSKTDQLGTRPRDPHHIYANPVQPELCPILALGVFWLSYEYSSNDPHLFPGDRQSNRFRDVLTRTLKLPEVDLANEERANLGTHSFRKGSSSYASCGATSGPSATAVHIRAGWSLGAIQNSYLRHVDAGDMYVGRTLSGLPIMEPEFASGPPHFLVSTEPSARAVENAMSICFPSLPVSARTIGRFVLASLVYHADFLKSRLPPTHPVLVSTLFNNTGILHRLQRLLAPPGSQDITLTGIPPHVVLQQHVRDLTGEVKSLAEEVKLLRAEVSTLRTELNLQTNMRPVNPELNAAVPVTTDMTDITQVLDEIREVKALLAARPASVRRDMIDDNADEDQSFDIGTQGLVELSSQRDVRQVEPRQGRLSIVPAIVSLPTGSSLDAWVKWVCGEPERRYPPYRRLQPYDLCDKDKNRLPDLRFLMQIIEDRAKELSLNTRGISAQDAACIYQKCSSSIEVPCLTEKGRKRRRGQLVWLSIVSILRKQKRRKSS